MVDVTCPWCEHTLLVEFEAETREQSCPECLTTWTYATPGADELALAA